MLQKLLTYIKEGADYFALEVSGTTAYEQYHLVHITRKKQELFIKQHLTFEKLSAISKHLKKGSPFLLIINTDKVLTKTREVSQTDKAEVMAHRAFPNLDFNTFYIATGTYDNFSTISIANKEYVNKYLQRLADLGLEITSFSLGISAIQAIAGFSASDVLYTSTMALNLKDGSLNKLATLAKNLNTIDALKVGNSALLGFAAIVGFISHNPDNSNFKDLASVLTGEFRNKRLYGLMLKSAIGIVLGLLLLNFALYMTYFDKIASLQTDVSSEYTSEAEVLDLAEDTNQKERIIEAIANASNSKTSYYLDQIALKLPPTILLAELNYQPLKRPVKPAKQIQFFENEINVSGLSSNSENFSHWLQVLDNLKWVNTVETVSYAYTGKNASEFTIKISIHEE